MAQIPNEERKTLILTGASRGIGHATVKRFSSAGWRVITCSRHPFPEDCPSEAGPEDHIQVELADPENTLQAIEVMKERLKAQGRRLNALVNNAAISPKGEGGARLGTIDTPHRDWLQVFPGQLLRAADARPRIDRRTREGFGRRRRQRQLDRKLARAPLPRPAYATSKAALAALTREMAADFAPRGIRVNAISPGEIDTAILSPGTEKLITEVPMARLGQPEEVAKVIYFLCTEQSSYINGTELYIDGGQHV